MPWSEILTGGGRVLPLAREIKKIFHYQKLTDAAGTICTPGTNQDPVQNDAKTVLFWGLLFLKWFLESNYY